VVRNAADGGGRGAGVPPGVGTTTVPWVVGTGFGTTPKVVRVPVSSVVTLGAEGTGIGVSEGAELVLEDDASEGVLSSGPVEMLLGGAGVVSISVLGEGSGVGDGVELEGGGEGGGVGFGGGFEGGMTGVFVGEPGAWGVVMVFPGGLAGAGPLPIGNGSSSHFSVISTC
jgi:hypothetical protein